MASLRAAVLAFLAALWAAGAVAQYSHIPASDDGTGIVYMGREIAQVMGHEGADWLERPERLTQEQPDKVIDAMQLRPTDTVADIGAGTGYFSVRMARRVPQGTVVAEDIQPEMIQLLQDNMRTAGAANIKTVLGTTSDPHLPPDSIDKALLVDTYHEFDQPKEMIQGVIKGLKPDGQIVFVEYRGEDPDVPIKPHHKMTEAQLTAEMNAVGLHLVRRFEELPWQHVLIYGR
jgi:ubiquinone/menaquinone biosynthesis C-methylase UbiE